MAAAPATLHRLELVHIVLAAIWAAPIGLIGIADWSSDPEIGKSVLAMGADGLIFLYLGTVAAWIRVTPTHLLVYNPFVKYVVPRHVIRDVDVVDYWFVPRLLVDGRRPIRLVVLNRNLPRGMDYGPSRRDGQLIMRMLREAPAAEADARRAGEATSDKIHRRWRWVNLALATFMAVSAIAIYRQLLG
jgi:hypothetical protein